MAATDEYEPCETIWDFLQLKGSVGLLTLLHERPRMFSELESEMEITSSTISRRRTDADALGLLTVELESDEHGTKHVYTLTDMGEHLAKQMALNGITHDYTEMRDHQRKIEKKTADLIDWVGENPSELLQYNAASEGRVAPREDAGLPPELDEIQATKEKSVDEADTSKEETETDTDNEEPVAEDDSSERAHPPSDKMSSDVGTSSEDETQGTFDDISGDDDDSEPVDEDSDA